MHTPVTAIGEKLRLTPALPEPSRVITSSASPNPSWARAGPDAQPAGAECPEVDQISAITPDLAEDARPSGGSSRQALHPGTDHGSGGTHGTRSHGHFC